LKFQTNKAQSFAKVQFFADSRSSIGYSFSKAGQKLRKQPVK
jgi:hypothetical protein